MSNATVDEHEALIMAAAFDRPPGVVCDAVRLHPDAAVRGDADAQVLSLSLLKLDAQRRWSRSAT